MTTGPENQPPATWRTLAASLRGSFVARTRGLLNPEMDLLDADGEPFGRLEPHGARGATLTAGDVGASIERADASSLEMTSGGVRLLTARTRGPATAWEIRTTHRAYDADLSLLGNRATAHAPGNRTVARISGGLSNRRHEATFDPEDADALPVALFLLYHLAALRSTAYQARA